MDLSNATILADFGSGIGTPGSVIQIDDVNKRLGIGTDTPQAVLQVGTGVTVYGNIGTIAAGSFYGDGSALTGVAATDYVVSNTLKVLGISTFVDNVSIGGTLTYEDVTNVDSVGIITARTGIKVLAGGINAVGVVTATSFSGDGSNLNGVESGVKNFVASGTIDNGKTLVLNSDGTVGIVTGTIINSGVGTEAQFNGYMQFSSVTYVGNSKVVISYSDTDNNSYGTGIVGTVIGTGITFTGAAGVFLWASSYFNSIAYDSNNERVVSAFANLGDLEHGYAVVGEVVGTGITFGTIEEYEGAKVMDVSCVYDSNEGKIVIAYDDDANSNYGTAVVGTVDPSNNSIEFGTPVVFESAATYKTSTTYDSTNQRVVIVYRDNGDNNKGTARVGTVSGTGASATITFTGAAEVFDSNECDYFSATFDSTNGKVVIAYRDETNSKAAAVVGTVDASTNTIGFGNPVYFNNDTTYISATYNSTDEKVVIAYRSMGGQHPGYVTEGTVSGDTVSFGSTVQYDPGGGTYTSSTYDSNNNKVIITYSDQGSAHEGTANVYTTGSSSTNLTSENYIGISGEAIANGATGKVNVLGGVNSGQSGLTTAKTYYIGQTGILTTTADTPSVVAGTSISDTKVLVR